MTESVSVLIPMFNSERWICETIESVLCQTWKNLEIIIVDDGSTDNSYTMVKSFKETNIKIIFQENRGCAAARNRALLEAQGDFIQFLDADDLLAVDKIELQVKRFIKEGNYNCITSGEWARFFSSPSTANFSPEPVWKDMSPINWLICSWEGGGMMHPAAWLIPRALSEKAGRFDEIPCPDAEGEYMTRVLLNSECVLFCEGARSFYRSGILGSLSKAKNPEMLTALYRSVQMSTNHLLSVENSSRTRKASATLFQRFIYATYPDLPALVKQAEARVQCLGGSDLKPGGGLLFQTLCKTIGWKAAKQIQSLTYRYQLKQNFQSVFYQLFD